MATLGERVAALEEAVKKSRETGLRTVSQRLP